MEITRISKLRNKFNEFRIDALLVSNFYNILYLTGFKTLTNDEREAWILVTKKNVYLFTDSRYLNKNFQLRLIEPGKGVLYHLKEIISKEKIKKLGIEGDDLRLNEYQKLKKTFPDVNIVSTEKLIIKLREVKDDEEIEKIEEACEITDHCLKEIIKTIKLGMTEKELAFKIEYWLKEKGYDSAFDPIIAIDKNSAVPHYHTKVGMGKVTKNSIILADFGAKREDYVSDITRMIFVKPETRMINVYNRLLMVQEKTIKELEATRDPKIIDTFCRGKLAEFNLPAFPHSLGHGLGLEIHEYPKISQTSTDEIKENQVFTIEPGVYFEGKWGMRIEDTVAIGNNSQPKILTEFSKQPLII